MAIGLDLWMVTLKMRDNFGTIWNAQDGTVQELMQTAVSTITAVAATAISLRPVRLTNSSLVRLLRLSQQHLPRLHHGRYLPEPGGRGPPAGMCYACQLIRKHIRGQYLHCCVRYGRHSGFPDHVHGRPSQGPKGARTVPVHRRKERRPRYLLRHPYNSPSPASPVHPAPSTQPISDTEYVNQPRYAGYHPPTV